MVEEKGKSGERRERSGGLVESGLVLIFSRATTCHRDHLALDTPVDTLLGGNVNGLCSEILHSCRWGSENLSCPNARSIENLSICMVTYSTEIEWDLYTNDYTRNSKSQMIGGTSSQGPHAQPGPLFLFLFPRKRT